MAAPAKAIEARLASIESRIADTDTRELLTRMQAQMTEIQTALVELQQSVPAIMARAPQPLEVAQVEKILDDNPHTKFVALTNHGGLRAGERFDSTSKFRNRGQFLSNVRGQKLKVAAAA